MVQTNYSNGVTTSRVPGYANPFLDYVLGPSAFDYAGKVGAAQAGAAGTAAAADATARGTAAAAANQAQGQAWAGMYGGLGNAEAGRYAGLGNIATALSNDNANRYGAYAQAEAARQTALGNIGSAGLGAWGDAAGQSLQAWALNQQAYNQALAGMQAANQQGMSQYGISRNNALGQLGTAAGDAGGRLGAATAVGDLSAEFGGGMGGGSGDLGFNVTGTGGTVSTGSLSPSSPQQGGLYGTVNRSTGASDQLPGVADATFGSIADSRNALMDPSIMNSLNYGALDGLNRLDAQHSTSRYMPSQMLDQTLQGLYGLTAQSQMPISTGMNQFYGSMGNVRPDYSPILGALSRPTQFDSPSLRATSVGGSTPTAQSLFGNSLICTPNMFARPSEADKWLNYIETGKAKMAYEDWRERAGLRPSQKTGWG
jgi:hypothetical protein